jgi:hypothetical protein
MAGWVMKRARTGLRPEVNKSVADWEKKRGLKVLSPELAIDPVRKALEVLVNEGCGPADIVSVLELLLAYSSTPALDSMKAKRRLWLRRAKNLVLRLRRLATDAEKVLDFIRCIPPAEPQEKAESNPSQPSPTGANRSYPPLDIFNEPELWDVMRTHADNLEFYIGMEQDKDFPLGEVFKRKFTGTLFWLVLAAGLVEEVTDRPHYAQLATLMERVCPTKALDETSLEKKINRFKNRNLEFVDEYLKTGQLRLKIAELLTALRKN